MTEPFDYSTVPPTYAHCLQADCPQAGNCLRRRLALIAPADIATFRVVNPAALPADGPCPHFRSVVPERQGVGICHLFDTLPHATAVEVKRDMRRHFGDARFYRFMRGELPVTQREQAEVARIFSRHGAEAEPAYDSYVERYDWEA